MKIHLRFNHDKKSTLDALDSPVSKSEANELLHKVIEEYMTNDELDKKSHLSELIHNRLDYSLILYMATNALADELRQAAIKGALRDFLNRQDDEII